MSTDFAIRLENLSKSYRIPKRGRGTFRGAAAVALDALMGRSGASHRQFNLFPALQPLDLTIGRGESVAIVGRNGSGKSTLLQLIAKTLEPTTGRAVTRGRVSALLELGSGFNPDYTGIENIFLNGAILGLNRRRIEEKLEDILDFADIGSFVEQPVRTYSSGMRMRLAFAVITAVEPEILIIDEALSVGDAFFQSSCSRWLEDYVSRGNTFLCVSHDMFMIKRLCRRGIVLDGGKVMGDLPVAEAANLYYRFHWKRPALRGRGEKKTVSGSGREEPGAPQQMRQSSDMSLPPLAKGWEALEIHAKERTGDKRLIIDRVATNPGTKGGCIAGDWLAVRIDFTAREAVERFHAGFGFRDRSGQLIGGHHSFYRDESYSIGVAGSRGTLWFEVKLDLMPQVYLVIVGLAINHSFDDWEDIDCLWDCANLMVSGQPLFWGLTPLPVRALETAGAVLSNQAT